MHVAVPVLPLYKELNSSWWVANIFDSSMRFCVPAFLMITGVLLLDREIHLKYFLSKRFMRILLPFLFWNSAYILYNYITGYIPVNLYMIKWVGIKFLHGASFHLWYIYLILGIYLFIPVINKWISSSTLKELQYFLIIWVITLLINLPVIKTYAPSVELIYFSGYLGYVILGYYLYRLSIDISILRAFLVFLSGVLLTAVGTYYFTLKTGKFNTSIYSYLTPNVALASIGMFMMLKNSRIENRFLKRVFYYLSKHSLGIYLTHILIFKLILITGINWEIYGIGIAIVIQFILCISLSYALIFLLRKIPYGKYISG